MAVPWKAFRYTLVGLELSSKQHSKQLEQQIWVNLPKKDKMIAPGYQDVAKDQIPVVKGDRFIIKVIAGEALGHKVS